MADPRYRRIRAGRPIPGGATYQRRPRSPLGAVPAVPVVLTVGVNGVTATSANVIGAVNPNGPDPTVWWVTYGTSLPMPGPSSTVSESVGSGTLPVTVTRTLTGLTAGMTYYVAVVGQNSHGTVIGQTLSFTAVAPAQPATAPVVPFGQPSVTIPHFNLPFTLVTSGTQQGAVVVEQDTLEEVLACVTTVVDCPVGACSVLPNFGVPNMAFAQAPLNLSELVATIQDFEPRANTDVVSRVSADTSTAQVAVAVSSAGTETS